MRKQTVINELINFCFIEKCSFTDYSEGVIALSVDDSYTPIKVSWPSRVYSAFYKRLTGKSPVASVLTFPISEEKVDV